MADKTHTSRLASYKNAGGHAVTDLRRKRAELSVALRKQARDEQLLKRRAVSPEPGDDVLETEKTYTPAEIVQGLKSPDLSIKTAAARAGRRMLSKEQNPPITAMVAAGIVPPLVAALDQDDCPDLQFEAAWAITNIASGTREHTMSVVDGGAVPKLITLLSRTSNIAEQAAWALGNIAGDGPVTRDLVLKYGALQPILPYFTTDIPSTQLRTIVWFYSNLCRNKNPMVKFELVSPALPHIAELLVFEDQDVLADACWALSYLTDGPNDRIEAVQTTNKLTPRLIALLGHKAASVKTPALRALGNMLTGTDVQTDRCIEAGCIPHIVSLLQSNKSSLVKEAAWAASNILAGTSGQIQKALDGGVIQPLVNVLINGDAKCQREAAWAITNLCLGGSCNQLDSVISTGFLEPYCNLLKSPEATTVILVLDGLTNLLQAAAKYGQIEALCLNIEEMGVLDTIEALQQHANEDVYKRVLNILDTYFCDQQDENAAPAQNAAEYQFGVNQNNSNLNF